MSQQFDSHAFGKQPNRQEFFYVNKKKKTQGDISILTTTKHLLIIDFMIDTKSYCDHICVGKLADSVT